MEFREYLRIILAYRRMIFFLTLVTAIIATAGSFLKTTKYEATTTALMKSALTQPKVSIQGYGYSATEDMQTKGETFKTILNSRVIAEKTVKILELEKTLSNKQKPYNFSIIKWMSSILQKLMDYILYGEVKERDPTFNLVKEVQKSISTSLIPKTTMFEIKVKFTDPKLAAGIANTATMVFIEHFREMNSAEARIVKEFIAERVIVAEKDLVTAQDFLRTFIMMEGRAYPEKKANLILTELVSFETSLKTVDSEIDQIKISLPEIRQKLRNYDKTLITSSTTILNPIVQDLRNKLIGVEIQRSNFSVNYGPIHPKILALDKEINEIKTLMDTEVKKIIQREEITLNPIYQKLLSELISKEINLNVYQEKRKNITEIIKDFPSELKISADKQIEWDTLFSSVQFAQKNLDSLKTQLESARITEAQKLSTINIIDPAIPPKKSNGLPTVGFTLLGLFVGFMCGTGLAFFLEYIDDSVKDMKTIEEDLKLPVYGVIPEIKLQNGKIKRKDTRELDETSKMAERLVTHFEPKSPIAEAYRSLRTNIQFAGIKAKTMIFLITSTFQGEGKTTTVANLCITLAQLGSKTLLIDADMRNPTLHLIFGKQKEPGLSNFIVGVSDLNEIIVQSGIENLDIITSGPIPPNPSELLSSERVDQLIEKIKDNYDFILFDSPPVIAVTDAVILSSKVDGVFLVIHAGKSSKGICLRAKILLEKVNANILGAILNNVKVKSGYGYEYYYQYHYSEGRSKKKKT